MTVVPMILPMMISVTTMLVLLPMVVSMVVPVMLIVLALLTLLAVVAMPVLPMTAAVILAIMTGCHRRNCWHRGCHSQRRPQNNRTPFDVLVHTSSFVHAPWVSICHRNTFLRHFGIGRDSLSLLELSWGGRDFAAHFGTQPRIFFLSRRFLGIRKKGSLGGGSRARPSIGLVSVPLNYRVTAVLEPASAQRRKDCYFLSRAANARPICSRV